MTRIIVYALVGLVLSAAGIYMDSEWFWCLLALFICSDYLSRREGYEQGMVFIATLPQEHLDKIKQEIKKLEAKD